MDHGEGHSRSEHVVKISQRPSKSCTECIRRKTRCNKKVPCDQCVKRGVNGLCRLEPQYRPGSLTSAKSPGAAPDTSVDWARYLSAELAELRARVAVLEQGVTYSPRDATSRNDDTGHMVSSPKNLTSVADVASKDHVGMLDISQTGGPSGPGSAAMHTVGGSAIGQEDDVEDAATTLEFFALGLDRRLGGSQALARRDWSRHLLTIQPRLFRRSHILPTPTYHDTPESVKDAILPRQVVHRILAYAESDVLWQHCCVFFPYLWRELDGFWLVMDTETERLESSTWARVEPTWIALLYSIMGIAVHQMDDIGAIRSGLSNDDRLVLPNALISAAEDALNHAGFLSSPTIWTVQTIAILALCGHNVCESDLLSSLLAVGIRMAQGFGLHSLGGRHKELVGGAADDISEENADAVIEVELGKRIWWALVQEDWFAIPFCGVWTIQPDHFDTPLPLNCADSDLMAGRYSNHRQMELCISFKQRFSSTMARIVQSVFQRLRRLTGSSTSASVVEDAVSSINNLLRDLPQALRKDSPSVPIAADAKYAAAMRHYIQVSAQHKLLVVYRALLAHGTTAHYRAKAQRACVCHAQNIIAEIERAQTCSAGIQKFWTIPYHGLAAAVVLVLDLIGICRNGMEASDLARCRRGEVVRARSALERLSPTSRIARRGLRVLSDLLNHAETSARGKKRNSDGEILHMVRDITVPANEVFEDGDGNSTDLAHTRSNTPNGQPMNASSSVETPVAEMVAGESAANPQSSSIRLDTLTPTHEHSQAPNSTVPLVTSPDVSWIDDFALSQEETDELLRSLQDSIPDVGRLFDGSIGSFS